MIKNEKGLTLIVLVITIIVLIIIAGISLKMTVGNDGIIKNTKEDLNSAEVSSELEQLNTIVSQALSQGTQEGYGSFITKDAMYVAIKDVAGENEDGSLKMAYTTNADGSSEVVFKNSLRKYKISMEGEIDKNYEKLEDLSSFPDEFNGVTSIEMLR